jgi:hypothetical protein
MSEPVSLGASIKAIWYRQRERFQEGPGEPNWVGVLVAASLAGLVVISLWRFQHQLGPSFVALFAKEGPFEDVTYILALFGAVCCAGAVWRFSRKGSSFAPPRIVRWMFGALGLALFAVAMEEINWGQTLLGFSTPEAWKEVNYQQETSIHNLLGRNALEGGARSIGVLLTLAVIVLVAVRVRSPKSLAAQVAPHPTLVPLSFCIAYAGFRQHSEVVELLISIFFAFYTYRLWALARTRAVIAGIGALPP